MHKEGEIHEGPSGTATAAGGKSSQVEGGRGAKSSLCERFLQLSHQKVLGNGKANYTGNHFVTERETKEDLKKKKQKKNRLGKGKRVIFLDVGVFFC